MSLAQRPSHWERSPPPLRRLGMPRGALGEPAANLSCVWLADTCPAMSSSAAQFAPHFLDHILEVRLCAVPFTDEAVQIVWSRRSHGLCLGVRGGGGSGDLRVAQRSPTGGYLPLRQGNRTLGGCVSRQRLLRQHTLITQPPLGHVGLQRKADTGNR